MSAEPPEKRIWTAQEYLAWERLQPTKHEFFQGVVREMAGLTLAHSLLVVGVAAELRNALREGPCEVYLANLRMKVLATGLYTYPDEIGRASCRERV
jgi:Uma2 family endonuclease